MSAPPRPTDQVLSPSFPSVDSIPQELRSTLADIWHFFRRPQDLDDNDVWPCSNITATASHLVPPHNPDAGPIPPPLAAALELDFRKYGPIIERCDHFSFYISDKAVMEMNRFWLQTLHHILVTFTNCSRPRTRNASPAQCIIANLEGFDCIDDEPGQHNGAYRPGRNNDESGNYSEPSRTREYEHRMDLSSCIKVITYIFEKTDRITGDEDEPFFHRLQPILDQMEDSNIPDEHKVPTLFYVLTGRAKEAAQKIRLNSSNIDDFVNRLSALLVKEHNIQQRKMNRWNTIQYSDFRSKVTSEHEATGNCTDYLTAHRKDLPDHMNNSATLLEHIRAIFKDLPWCMTLYERTTPNQDAHTFGQLLKTAASNYDEREKRKTRGATPSFPVNPCVATNPIPELVANFFAKTRPPPYHRRPHRYQRRGFQNRHGNRHHGRYGNYRNRNFSRFQNRIPSQLQTRRCFGCRMEGHILRNCPEKHKYTNCLQNLKQVGTAAVMLIESMDQEPTAELEEIANYLADYEDDVNEPDETPEFDTWICDLLDIIDSNDTDSFSAHHLDTKQNYYVNDMVPQLPWTTDDTNVHSVISIFRHLLLDTGAPKSICSLPWLSQAHWTPVKTLPLPVGIKPFRFAGSRVQAVHAAGLVAKVEDMQGQTHILRQFVFILPPTTVPFLVGLQTFRSHSVDICLREGPHSHLKVNDWNATAPIVVNSHIWMEFEPCNSDPDPDFDWGRLMSQAFKFTKKDTLFNYMVYSPESSEVDHGSSFVIPPWERDGWHSKLTEANIEHLHSVLRHPTSTSLLNLIRQQYADRKIPQTLKRRIEEQQKNCRPCNEFVEMPRKPKLALPPLSSPNVAVSLDVMPQIIRGTEHHILVILDAGDMLLRLCNLSDDSARTAFNAYLYRWITIFDAPAYTYVDRCTNLTNKFMADSLRLFESQLCPIPTEASWSIGNNERSHRFQHKAIEKTVADPTFEIGDNLERLLAEIEMAWNFTQHKNRTLPHFNRFGVMPRVLGELETSPTIQCRVALMEMARTETASARATQVLSNAFNAAKRHVTKIPSFNVGQKVWFHRRKYGWREGVISRIDRPTISVSFSSKLFPTHETRVRPFHGEAYFPPEIRDEDCDELEMPDTQSPPDQESAQQPSAPTQTYGRAPVAQLLNSTFITSDNSATDTTITTDDIHYEDPFVFLTSAKPVKSLKKLPPDQQAEFLKAKQGEINFLLQQKSVMPVPRANVEPDCEIQPMKWILFIKRSPNQDPPVRYRARLVSASHLTNLRHSLNGNAPTVAMCTVRCLLSIIPTSNAALRKEHDEISIIVRDVTKAYLKSMPTKRLVYYRPPPEYFGMHPDEKDSVWKGIVQVYGDVEAGKYWNKTLVRWLCDNIMDLKQSIYDPSLLYSPTKPAATALCTDDKLSALPKSQESEEAKVTARFKCRDAQRPPVDFKGLDISQDGADVIASQMVYLNTIAIADDLSTMTKPELMRTMNDKKISSLRSDAGKLAWIATGTSPLSSFHTSVALQRNRERPIPHLQLLLDTRNALPDIKERRLATLRFTMLDEDSLHIRVYSDDSFQNLITKHSQIGFLICFTHKSDAFNLVHWHSSRAPRRAHSTEESELMALDAALRCINNLRMIIFQIVKKEVPIVVYIDNQTLWDNLMNETVPSIPEIGYRCREPIQDGRIASVCLIPGDVNPADAMTKAKPNKFLAKAIASNKCETPSKRIFMLQDSKYRNTPWIPTATVPMPQIATPSKAPD